MKNTKIPDECKYCPRTNGCLLLSLNYKNCPCQICLVTAICSCHCEDRIKYFRIADREYNANLMKGDY